MVILAETLTLVPSLTLLVWEAHRKCNEIWRILLGDTALFNFLKSKIKPHLFFNSPSKTSELILSSIQILEGTPAELSVRAPRQMFKLKGFLVM